LEVRVAHHRQRLLLHRHHRRRHPRAPHHRPRPDNAATVVVRAAAKEGGVGRVKSIAKEIATESGVPGQSLCEAQKYLLPEVDTPSSCNCR
jgi:hypothetical protein